MDTQRYMHLCNLFAPRLISDIDEYHGARTILMTFTGKDGQIVDDASMLYVSTLTKLLKLYEDEWYEMLRKERATDGAVLRTVRNFHSLPDEEFFHLTGLTPFRVKEIYDGQTLSRIEIAVLEQTLLLPPGLFNSDVLKAVDKTQWFTALRRERGWAVMLNGTAMIKAIPGAYLDIPFHDGPDQEQTMFLSPEHPAYRYHIAEYVEACRCELLAELWPEEFEKRKKAELAAHEDE